MQFCLEFDPNDYSFESYNSDLLSLDEFNFNIQHGQIKFSWDHDNGIFMQTGKTILNLKFKQLSNKISAFGFNESVMISELIETDGRTTSIELKLLPSNIGAPLVSFIQIHCLEEHILKYIISNMRRLNLSCMISTTI